MKKIRYISYLVIGIAGVAALVVKHLSEPDAATSPYHPAGDRSRFPHTVYADPKDTRMANPHYSRWRESVKALYRQTVEGTRPDILVLPFEVQMHPMDKIGRSLMTRHLIRSLKKRADQSVSEFDVIDRALGFNRLRFMDAEVNELVLAIEPSIYVRTYVGHQNRKQMQVSIVVYERDSTRSGRYQETRRKNWRGLSFEDKYLPYQVFAERVDEFASFVSPRRGTEAAAPPRGVSMSENISLPQSPADIVDGFTPDPATQALALQTFGVLTPVTNSRERQRLFERSLMKLLEVPPQHPEYPVLKARALFYLSRRPLALAALENIESIEAEAFRQYMNANLVSLATTVEKIPSSWKRLLARIELNQLANSFGYKKEFIPGWTDEFYTSHPRWRPLVASHLTAGDSFARGSLAEIKRELDRFYPWSLHSLESTIIGMGSSQNRNDLDLSLTEAIANHAQAALKSFSLTDIDATDVGKLDYVNLLEGVTQWVAIKRLRLLLDVQALPDEASKLAGRYLRIYDGHEDLLFHELRANLKTWEKTRGVAKSSFKAAYPAALSRVIDLAPEHDGEYYRYLRDLRKLQLAMKADRNGRLPNLSHLEWRKRSVQSVFPPKHVVGLWTLDPERTLAYVHDDLNALWDEYHIMKKEDKAGALALWEGNRQRFEGHRRLPNLVALVAADRRAGESARERDEAMGEHYRNQVAAGSFEWTPYWEIGSRHVVAGRYDDALAVFKQYPGFLPSSSVGALRRTNNAGKAGSELFWHGAHEQAIPLYELSARQHTGAEYEMASRARMATIRGDFGSAILNHYNRGTRYNSQYGFRDSMSLLHVVGEGDQAWALFDALLGRYDEPTIWDSALVGHRISGMSTDEIVSWLTEKGLQADESVRRKFLRRYALMALTMDRPASDEIPDAIGRIRDRKEFKVQSFTDKGDSVLVRFEFDGTAGGEAVLSKAFVDEELRVGELVPPEYSFFAGGYDAIKRGDFDRAHRILMNSFGIFPRKGLSLHAHYSYPYLIRAAVKAGESDTIERALSENHKSELRFSRDSEAFDLHLGMAFMLAEDGDHDGALEALNWAFGIKPHTKGRPMMPWYQVVEAAVWLYEDFDDPRYLSRALEWARSYQVIAPMHGWAFAVVAKYSKDPDERLQALAMALYLDRDSWLLSEIPSSEKQTAQGSFKDPRLPAQPQNRRDGGDPSGSGGIQSRLDAREYWSEARA